MVDVRPRFEIIEAPRQIPVVADHGVTAPLGRNGKPCRHPSLECPPIDREDEGATAPREHLDLPALDRPVIENGVQRPGAVAWIIDDRLERRPSVTRQEEIDGDLSLPIGVLDGHFFDGRVLRPFQDGFVLGG
ncbi:MAG: hypothetical protein MZV64_49925 [Ignavibacteriales bacterium]|nr:hypothetical protein [Ignavibacteriales bacterium]